MMVDDSSAVVELENGQLLVIVYQDGIIAT